MQSPSTPAFDRLMTFVSAWFIGGIYLDGWAHNHLDSALETFFTPWHAVMYSGFAAVALTLFVKALGGRKAQGTLRLSPSLLNPWTWSDSVPAGYFPSLIGAAVFAFGGGFDVFWHLTFGIENGIEALLSPAHLILGIGAFLMVSGPFRAAWRSAEPPRSLASALPMILSMAFMLSVISFLTQFAHPVRHLADGLRPLSKDMGDLSQGRAVAGFLLQLTLLTGLAMYAIRRWGRTLPFGSLTLLFGVNMAGMSLMVTNAYEFRLIPATLGAGLLADWLRLRVLRNPETDAPALRVFAAAVPAAYAALVFVILRVTGEVWWSTHMWSGTIVMAGIAGLLSSYLAVPPDATVRPAQP